MKRDTMVSTTAREILRRARRQQGLTQKELAERAGVSQNVVARYEASRQQPTIAALERLMAACGCELVWSVRHATASSAAVGMPDAALMVNAADAGAGARFPDRSGAGSLRSGTKSSTCSPLQVPPSPASTVVLRTGRNRSTATS